MIPRLSALTPDVVDNLYGISTAKPVEAPIFVFLLGTPGVGKSSGHPSVFRNAAATSGYATINLDTLLENLRPFRIGSSMAWWLSHHSAGTEPARKFTGLPGYVGRRENASALSWWDKLTPEEKATAPPLFHKLYASTLNEKLAPSSLIGLNDEALKRAIHKSINILYETTVSLNKDGRVKKVDDLMDFIKKHAPQYTVYFVLVTGEIDEVATRIAARQEYNMPYQSEPFWRRVPTNVGSVEDLMSRNEAAFHSLEKQYGDDKRARFERITNKMNASRLPPARNFNADSSLERIRVAYNSELGMSSTNRNSKYTNTGRRLINVPYNTSGAPRAGAGEDPHPSKTHNRNTRNRNARNRNTRNTRNRNTRRRQ
jgi:hypothetical protein